jgi:hypothetical protein
MNDVGDGRVIEALESPSRILARAVVVVCVVVLLGMALDLEPLKRVVRSFSTMKPNTATCLAMFGAALALRHQGAEYARRASRALALVVVTLVAASTLLVCALGVDRDIDRLLFPDVESAVTARRRSPMTAVALLPARGAVSVLDVRVGPERPRPSEWLALMLAADGAVSHPGYARRLVAPLQLLHGAQEFPGAGFALATARRIVLRHGGRSWADGAVDVAVTFLFTVGESRRPS